MTINITKWKLDTCDCIVRYEWDNEVPQAQRVHSVYDVIRKCTAHQNMSNNTDLFLTIAEENPRKNFARQVLLDNGPAQMYDVTDTDGNRDFKKGINLSWSWSGIAPNRTLTITLTGYTLTSNQKNVAQTGLDNRFGSGKVILIN